MWPPRKNGQGSTSSWPGGSRRSSARKTRLFRPIQVLAFWPSQTTTYTLVATNLAGTASASITITVKAPAAPVLGPAPQPVFQQGVGGNFQLPAATDPNGSTLTYGVPNPLPAGFAFDGVQLITVSGETIGTYSLLYTVTNGFGVTSSDTITVTVAAKPVITSFTANPPTITKGTTTTLAWSVQGATSLKLNGQNVTGSSLVVGPSETSTYTLVATNVVGTTSSSLTVTVKPKVLELKWKRDILYLGQREVGEVDANGVKITLTDHLGTPRVVVDGGGTIISKQKFTPFGESLTTSPESQRPGKGFTNHEQTDPSGLIYMQARYCLPMYGRFESPDPELDQQLEDIQSWNLYSYVRNNPVNSIDPTGTQQNPKIDRVKEEDNAQTEPKPPHKETDPKTGKESWVTEPIIGELEPRNGSGTGRWELLPLTIDLSQIKYGKVYGTGTCTDLGKAFGMPNTGELRDGGPVTEDTPDGTLVGTLFNNGRYKSESGKGHVGFKNGFFKNRGLRLKDQYANSNGVKDSILRSGNNKNYNSNADHYRVLVFWHRAQ